MSRPASAFLVILLASLLIPFGAAAGSGYDVSYVWAGNLDNVRDYKRKVGHVLGPVVSRNLEVVVRGDLYGVIYHRRGGSQGATKVARAHTRLLTARGLDPAAPIRSRDWRFVGSATGLVKASYSPPSQPEPSSSGSAREAPGIGDLSAAVDRHVKSLRRRGLVAADERTAWSVYDFTTGKKLVSINDDAAFQAASLIKPFLAMAFFHKVENEELIYGPRSRRHMERMIRYSSNRSTNWVMRHLGGPSGVQAMLKHHYGSIFQNTRIVEYIPAGGRTYRNKASAHDYSRFLYALWKGSVPGAREIKRLMSLPGPDRLVTGAEAVPEGIRVYNKTGSTAMLCGDIGILVAKDRNGREYPYIVVGIIEKQRRASNYSSWIQSRGDAIRSVSNLVYAGISRQHNLESSLTASGGI